MILFFLLVARSLILSCFKASGVGGVNKLQTDFSFTRLKIILRSLIRLFLDSSLGNCKLITIGISSKRCSSSSSQVGIGLPLSASILSPGFQRIFGPIHGRTSGTCKAFRTHNHPACITRARRKTFSSCILSCQQLTLSLASFYFVSLPHNPLFWQGILNS